MSTRAVDREHGAGGMPNCWRFLKLLDALSLQAFRTLRDSKLHRFAFIQRTVTFCLDGGVMDENIISGCALNKTIPLRVVEPLHYTLFSIHIVSVFLLMLSLTCSRLATAPQKQKKPQNHWFCGLRRTWCSVTKTDQASLVYTFGHCFAIGKKLVWAIFWRFSVRPVYCLGFWLEGSRRRRSEREFGRFGCRPVRSILNIAKLCHSE